MGGRRTRSTLITRPALFSLGKWEGVEYKFVDATSMTPSSSSRPTSTIRSRGKGYKKSEGKPEEEKRREKKRTGQKK
jgi:hypothetical protein